MSNVIRLNVPARAMGLKARRARLIEGVAQERRAEGDVFWLKECAELLNILDCTGAAVDPAALAPFEGFYDEIGKRLGFFPQYYRFLLSICLDLEDLGLPGSKGASLARWAATEGLADAELSDLQRAEARRLMLRRGVDPLPDDTGLTERLHAFMDRSETFSMPNKKAAYELTHIVFYLSEYGRRDPGLSDAAVTSLEYAGLLAYLEQNADLLAEICIALRYAGRTPSRIWEDWLAAHTGAFRVMPVTGQVGPDDCHEYFVCNWHGALCGAAPFDLPFPEGPVAFCRPPQNAAPLRTMSECMFHLDTARSDDWSRMRPVIEQALGETGHAILSEAQASTDKFDAFFSGFARTRLSGVAL